MRHPSPEMRKLCQILDEHEALPERYLSTQDAAAVIEVTSSALLIAVKRRELKAYIWRNRIFLELSQVYAWNSEENRKDRASRGGPKGGR